MYGLFALLRNLLLLVVVITVLRSVIGFVMKFFASFASGQTERPMPRSSGPATPIAGELFRDPVCGTFVASSTEFQRVDGRQHFYYCSKNCQAQHVLAVR